MDSSLNPTRMGIARERVVAPVPPPGKACKENGDDVFYGNVETDDIVCDHPSDEKYRQLVVEHQKPAPAAGSSAPADQAEVSDRQLPPPHQNAITFDGTWYSFADVKKEHPHTIAGATLTWAAGGTEVLHFPDEVSVGMNFQGTELKGLLKDNSIMWDDEDVWLRAEAEPATEADAEPEEGKHASFRKSFTGRLLAGVREAGPYRAEIDGVTLQVYAQRNEKRSGRKVCGRHCQWNDGWDIRTLVMFEGKKTSFKALKEMPLNEMLEEKLLSKLAELKDQIQAAARRAVQAAKNQTLQNASESAHPKVKRRRIHGPAPAMGDAELRNQANLLIKAAQAKDKLRKREEAAAAEAALRRT